jgi:prepilin-type processing-associated H-X9-DG protein
MTTGAKFGWASVIALIIIAIFVGDFVILGTRRTGDYAGQAKCASNLHQIGLAILLYQNENRGQFPRTISDDLDDPKPTWGTPYQSNPKLGPVTDANPFNATITTPGKNDVTAAFFLLARIEQLTPAVFVCPYSNQEAWDYGGGDHTANDWTNWQGNSGLLKNLSYSLQNPYASRKAIDAGFVLPVSDSTFAIASDINPGGSAVTSVTMRSTSAQMKPANSPNHSGDGQNVLYGDGHAEWMNNPFCGSEHDNIFTVGGPETAESPLKNPKINASPTGPQDSILLPTAADIGPK